MKHNPFPRQQSFRERPNLSSVNFYRGVFAWSRQITVCKTNSMATKAPKIMLLLILLIAYSSQPTEGLLQFGQCRTLFFLSHSLVNRVSNLRASRGDFEGADRARRIAEEMEGGLGLGSWGGFLSMGWDYARNYAWRDLGSSKEMSGVVSDANEILDTVKELIGMESEKERVRWISQNCQRVLDPSRSLLRRLLLVVARSYNMPQGQWWTLFSLSHFLMNRVSNLRTSRGDFEGADRARRIAEMFGVVSDANEILDTVKELSGMESEKERVRWISKNYQRVLDPSRWCRLLLVITHSGPLQEMLLIVQKEAQGELIRDCLEVGANDLKGLLQITKDITLNFGPLQEMLLIVQKEAQGELIRDCLEVGANDLKGLLQIAKDIALNFVSSPSSRSHPSEDL